MYTTEQTLASLNSALKKISPVRRYSGGERFYFDDMSAGSQRRVASSSRHIVEQQRLIALAVLVAKNLELDLSEKLDGAYPKTHLDENDAVLDLLKDYIA